MSPTETDIPNNPDALKAFIADVQAKLAASESARLASEQALAAEQEAHDATRRQVEAAQNAIKLTTLEIEKLKVQLARLRRMKFGQSSERLTMLADQLELTLEDIEAAAAHAHCVVGDATLSGPAEATRRKPRREPLPAHLPRDEIVHPAPQEGGCATCGGNMSALGEDVTEVLEYVPGRFRVARHVRPKLACDRCDVISQAPAPALPVPRGRAGPGLLAHVAVSKFADHLPLYRQSRIFAREGVDISRSTLADWLGQVSWLLDPLVERIAAHVMASVKIHADDTPVPVLAPGSGKTKTGRLWIYLRDNRRWSPSDRPAALYRYSPDRKVSDLVTTSGRSAGFYRPMPMPGSTASTSLVVRRARLHRLPAGRMPGANCTRCSRPTGHQLPVRGSRSFAICTRSSAVWHPDQTRIRIDAGHVNGLACEHWTSSPGLMACLRKFRRARRWQRHCAMR